VGARPGRAEPGEGHLTQEIPAQHAGHSIAPPARTRIGVEIIAAKLVHPERNVVAVRGDASVKKTR
jgi:hypothetical protein